MSENICPQGIFFREAMDSGSVQEILGIDLIDWQD
jgi:hypothetical protein